MGTWVDRAVEDDRHDVINKIWKIEQSQDLDFEGLYQEEAGEVQLLIGALGAFCEIAGIHLYYW